MDFSKTIEACDLKVGRCRQLIELRKVWKVKVISEKKSGRLISMKLRPRYQVSVYRTNGPLFFLILENRKHIKDNAWLILRNPLGPMIRWVSIIKPFSCFFFTAGTSTSISDSVTPTLLTTTLMTKLER